MNAHTHSRTHETVREAERQRGRERQRQRETARQRARERESDRETETERPAKRHGIAPASPVTRPPKSTMPADSGQCCQYLGGLRGYRKFRSLRTLPGTSARSVSTRHLNQPEIKHHDEPPRFPVSVWLSVFDFKTNILGGLSITCAYSPRRTIETFSRSSAWECWRTCDSKFAISPLNCSRFLPDAKETRSASRADRANGFNPSSCCCLRCGLMTGGDQRSGVIV
eukprot:104073-Rhodomonas_salina.4